MIISPEYQKHIYLNSRLKWSVGVYICILFKECWFYRNSFSPFQISSSAGKLLWLHQFINIERQSDTHHYISLIQCVVRQVWREVFELHWYNNNNPEWHLCRAKKKLEKFLLCRWMRTTVRIGALKSSLQCRQSSERLDTTKRRLSMGGRLPRVDGTW